MIYTLTLNPAIDKTVIIPEFTTDTVNRIQSIRSDIGGKGINVSKCLKAIRYESTAIALWGGSTGMAGIKYLQDSGIHQMSIRVQNETRTNLKIVDPVLHKNTDINEPGPEIQRIELNRLVELLDENIHPGDILILSGSIPRGIKGTIYRDIIFRYKQKQAIIYVDADGRNFRYAVDACPDFIKPNLEELNQYMNASLSSKREIIDAAKEFIHKGIKEIVVSLGSDGALLINNNHCYYAHGLSVPVQSTVGAGDSMVAAFAYGQATGLSDAQRLKLSIAISAASVMCSGSQAPNISAIKDLYYKVIVEEVSNES